MVFTYKRLTDALLPDLQLVFKNVFKKHLSLEYLKLKYDNSLHGGKYMAYLAYTENGEPIGFHGGTFYQMEYQGNVKTIIQGGDSMTDERFQGKGLFTKLGKIMQAKAEEEHVEFIYGFPNQNSYPGYIKKLDWKFTENMQCFSIPVRAIPFESFYRKLGLNELYQQLAVGVFKKHLVESRDFASTVITREYGGIRRDDRFYDYKRYSRNYILSIEDCKVWIKINGAIHVGDIENKSDDIKNKVIAKLKKIARRLGVSKIIFQASPNTHISTHLSKLYPYQETFPIGFYNINSDIPLEKLKFTYGDLDTF